MSADPNDVLATLLVVLAVLGWAATIILVRAARRTHWHALEERAGLSAMLTILRTGLGLFAVARLIDEPTPPEALALLIVAIFLTLGIIDVVWLVAYLAGRFDA